MTNDKARLLTPNSYTNDNCITFYYHMWGSSIGTLNILTQTNGALSAPIWQRTKNYGDEWNLAEVPLAANNVNYQVAFEGIVGTSFYGDIAIDDVQIEDRTCPTSGYCDFEHTPRFCTWSNIKGRRLLLDYYLFNNLLLNVYNFYNFWLENELQVLTNLTGKMAQDELRWREQVLKLIIHLPTRKGITYILVIYSLPLHAEYQFL